ncbi:Lethal(2) giant larvae sro7, partial [Cryomyces antarcticus]
AHKTWDTAACEAAAVVRYEDLGYALVGLFRDGLAKAYSIPALKEIGTARIDHILDIRRLADATITPSGDILGWTGPSEMAMLNVWGTGAPVPRSHDSLFNPQLPIPPRPTISNLQWISGTQYITPRDMDLLIGGPDRPPSKRMIAQARNDEQQRRSQNRGAASSSATGAAVPPQDEGYW